MVGTTRSRRQSRASGHLDMMWMSRGTWEEVAGCGAKLPIGSWKPGVGETQHQKRRLMATTRTRRSLRLFRKVVRPEE